MYLVACTHMQVASNQQPPTSPAVLGVQYEARPFLRKLRDRQAGITAETFSEARFLESACTKIDHVNSCVYCQAGGV